MKFISNNLEIHMKSDEVHIRSYAIHIESCEIHIKHMKSREHHMKNRSTRQSTLSSVSGSILWWTCWCKWGATSLADATNIDRKRYPLISKSFCYSGKVVVLCCWAHVVDFLAPKKWNCNPNPSKLCWKVHQGVDTISNIFWMDLGWP